MVTVNAFNELVRQFVSELKDIFPEEPKIKKMYNGLDMVLSANVRCILDVFMANIGPFTQYIMDKDERLLIDSRIQMLDDMNFRKLWTPELSDNTKNAIWQYLQLLTAIGSQLNTTI